MKTLVKFLVVFVTLSLVTQFAAPKATAQAVSFQVFYDDLSPYGTWVDNPNYGYVWVPAVGTGFEPYATNGYWVWTDYGWTWVSDYAWGWAPFHYGRWAYDPFYGPIWVPGDEWGPAWVDWRYSNGYYGWCPEGPSGYHYRDDDWVFVDEHHFGDERINNYYVTPTSRKQLVENSTVINNTRIDNSTHITYNYGPDKSDVEKHTGKTVKQVALKESNTPGQKVSRNEVAIYKPKVEKSVNGDKPAPKKVGQANDAKPAENAGQKVGDHAADKKNQEPVKTEPSKVKDQQQPANDQPSKLKEQQQPANDQPKASPSKQQTKPDKKSRNESQPANNQPAPQMKDQTPSYDQQTPAPSKHESRVQKKEERRSNNPGYQQQAPQQQQAPPQQQAPQQQAPPKMDNPQPSQPQAPMNQPKGGGHGGGKRPH